MGVHVTNNNMGWCVNMYMLPIDELAVCLDVDAWRALGLTIFYNSDDDDGAVLGSDG